MFSAIVNRLPALDPQRAPADASVFDRRWALLALFGLTATMLIAVAFLALRAGLPTPPLLVPGCVLIAAATLFAPLLVPARGPWAASAIRAVVLPVVAVSVLVVTGFALWFGRTVFAVYILLAAAGLWRGGVILATVRGRTIALVMGVAVMFAVYLFGVVHGLGLAGVYSPEQSLLGMLNHDTRFHGAIAYMIQNFGVASLGVDGLVPIKYHVGSHIFMAALGLMTGAVPAQSYGAAVPILLAPLLVSTFLLGALACNRACNSVRSYLAYGLALLLIADLFDWKSYYISESYTLGLIGLVLFLPMLVTVARAEREEKIAAYALIFSLAAIPFLSAFKVSVGILWAVALSWVIFRRYGLSWRTLKLAIVVLAMLVLALSLFSPGPRDTVAEGDLSPDGRLLVPFYLYRITHRIDSFSSFILPVLLVSLWALKSRTLFLRPAVSANWPASLVEATLFVTIVGAIPPLIGLPQNSSVWYFLNVCQWFAIVFLVAWLPPFDTHAMRNQWGPPEWITVGVAGLVLALPVVSYAKFGYQTSFYPTFFASIDKTVRLADRYSGGKVLQGRTVWRYIADSVRKEHVLLGAEFAEAVKMSPGAQIVRTVHDALGMPKADAAVFVPPSNTDYWNFAARCHEQHNIQVELTGRPSLFGAPPAKYKCPQDSYAVGFGDRIDAADMDDVRLCERAKKRGVSRVFILNQISPGPQNRILDCTQRSAS